MERGKFLEAEAFKYYGFVTESKPKKVGFVYKDECAHGGMLARWPRSLPWTMKSRVGRSN